LRLLFFACTSKKIKANRLGSEKIGIKVISSQYYNDTFVLTKKCGRERKNEEREEARERRKSVFAKHSLKFQPEASLTIQYTRSFVRSFIEWKHRMKPSADKRLSFAKHYAAS